MTDAQFQVQMNRLVETFGSNHYKPERIRLIYKLVLPYSVEWFTRLVDEFVGSCERAPLLPKFEEAVSLERERLWRKQKEQNEQDAKAFMAGKFTDEDVRATLGTIVGRLQGQINDNDWDAFNRVLKQYDDKGESK